MRPLASYSAVVVTYRRPASLDVVLRSLESQTATPTLVVVVDNDPEQSASDAVASAQHRGRLSLVHVPAGENLGPAGGWALGAEVARQQAGAEEWLLVVDDDDPLGHPEVISRLLDTAEGLPSPERCGAIGLRGATLRRWTVRLVREEAHPGPVQVDYLASGGAPLYRWSALDDVGFFDERLFFGFEDLEQGLRLRRGGWDLWASAMPLLHEVADSGRDRLPWREYYKVRSLTVVVRQHLGAPQLAWFTGRTVLLGSAWLTLRTQSPALAQARALGWFDGLRGRLGRGRYSPTTNPAKRPRPG